MTGSTLRRPIDIDIYYVMYQLDLFISRHGFSEREEQILKLCYEERKSFAEIGETLSIDRYEIGSLYHNCINRLRRESSIARKEFWQLKNVQDENRLLKRKIADLQKLLDKDSKPQESDIDSNILEKQFYDLEGDFDLRTNNALKRVASS